MQKARLTKVGPINAGCTLTAKCKTTKKSFYPFSGGPGPQVVKDKDGYYIIETGTKNYIEAASKFTYRSYVGGYVSYEVIEGDPYIVATGPDVVAQGNEIIDCGKEVLTIPAVETITDKTLLVKNDS